MIDSGEQYYAPGVMDYLNGYPAFRNTGGGTINNSFYSARIAALAHTCDPDYGDSFTGTVNRMIEKAGISKEEFDELIKPVIQVTWPRFTRKYRGKVTMEMAQAFLKFIEPFWCEFKCIRSTGYVDNLLRQASCLIDDEDDMFDI